MRPETKELYPPDWKDISRKVIERSNRICQDCKRSDAKHEVVLTTHHKDYNPSNNTLTNLLCLCQGCHLRQHGKDLKEAMKYREIDNLIRVGQLVFPGMEIKPARRLTRVIEGKALNTSRRILSHARPGIAQ